MIGATCIMIMSIGFIGAGNMASAIIETLRKTGYIKPENIYIYDTDIEKANVSQNMVCIFAPAQKRLLTAEHIHFFV